LKNCQGKKGMTPSMKVYILHHVHEFTGQSEDVKLIGVYSSQEEAEQAVKRLQLQPGFRDALASFEISEYEVDRDHWVEGYSTEYDTDDDEAEITDVFENLTADIVSQKQYNQIVQRLIQRTPGEWHLLSTFAQGNSELQRRIAELQNAISKRNSATEVPLYCQWTYHTGNSDFAVIIFYLEGWLLFQNVIHNISRFDE
jgi:hypothetical protein